MNQRKFLTFFLFISSFVVLSISGYQCATESIITDPTEPGGYTDPNAPYIGGPPQSNNPYTQQSPTSKETARACRHSDVRNASTGAIGHVKVFSRAALKDFRLGKSSNFDSDCFRIFVEMHPVTYNSQTVYQGSLNFAYIINGNTLHTVETISGYSSSDSRYNKWTSEPDKDDLTTRFQAIFQDAKGAYILKVNKMFLRKLGDGDDTYEAAGDIFYKMFRAAGVNDVHNTNRKGDCYNTSVYASKAHTPPIVPSIRCWFVSTGPYSCRPNGDLVPKTTNIDTPDETPIDLNKPSYKCYNKLGYFGRLNVEEAFNIKL